MPSEYNPKIIGKYEGKFKEVFGKNIRTFFNADLLEIGIMDFDIWEFNDWLISKGYDEEKESLKGYIERVHGKLIALMISNIIEEI